MFLVFPNLSSNEPQFDAEETSVTIESNRSAPSDCQKRRHPLFFVFLNPSSGER